MSKLVTSLVPLVALPLSLLGQASPGFFEHWTVVTLAPLAVFVLSRPGWVDAAQGLASAALALFVAHADIGSSRSLLSAAPALSSGGGSLQP